MPGALANLKHEWQAFKNDDPGERFQNHRKRMKRRSRAHSIAALIAGIVLLAVGLVLCFIPGPGIPLLVFGLALVATHWRWLAEKLDAAEPRLRARGRRLKQRLKRST
jgi:hypothetical protein